MALSMKRVLFVVLLFVLSPFILPSNAQQPAAPVKVNQITGLAGVKNSVSFMALWVRSRWLLLTDQADS